MFCFDFRSNFLVSISLLINIGKEMSLPGFRRSKEELVLLTSEDAWQIVIIGLDLIMFSDSISSM